MNDIVERLYDLMLIQSGTTGPRFLGPNNWAGGIAATAKEAAGEIERLREENGRLIAKVEMLRDWCRKLIEAGDFSRNRPISTQVHELPPMRLKHRHAIKYKIP